MDLSNIDIVTMCYLKHIYTRAFVFLVSHGVFSVTSRSNRLSLIQSST